MILDHTPVKINNFNGLFGIDHFTDTVPADHFISGLNLITRGKEIGTRDGFGLSLSFAAIVRFYTWRIAGQASRVIVLDNNGRLYDTTVSITIPILQIATMEDFSALPVNNRLFISPHNGITGLPGEFVYVYSGSGTARKAAGTAPSSGFNIGLGSAGNIEEGLHIFAWVYETNSGYVTPPGPETFQTITVDGTKALNFSNIPVGPSGTAKRRLLASRAIQDYNGDQEGYILYFVPDATIENNSATALNDVNFWDVDLQLDADYTFDQLDEIPAGVALKSYGRRMLVIAPNEDKSLVYISKSGEPESISGEAGFQSFDPFETEGVKDAVEFRGSLYVMKKNKTYVGTDNTYDPATWRFDSLESSIGSDINGVAKFIDATGGKSDFFITADSAGIFKFTGVYEEAPVSYKINNWWRRINKDYFNKVQLLLDPEKFLIYCLVPLDGVSSPNYIIVGDYESGLDAKNIKWHLWSFTDFAPSSIAIDIDNETRKTVLKASSLSGNIYSQETDRRNDNLTAISQELQFALLNLESNFIHHCGGIGLRIEGSGTLGMTLYGQNNVDTQVLSSMTLSSIGGREFVRQSHFQSERISLKLVLNSSNGWFRIWQVNMYLNVIFLTRPS